METLHRHCNSGFMSDSLPLVVVGAPGSGKTSLVAAFAKQVRSSDASRVLSWWSCPLGRVYCP
jgi:Cdc6-like AAA superfamily ATPase